MGQTAERVYTEQTDIDRIEALTAQLQDEANVELLLDNGGIVTGVVAVRPVVQTFLGPGGEEGLNALARIDDALEPGRSHYVWLGGVREVRRLGSH
ncbi:DUF3247 family protein [Luteimonas sp. RD2P54]|uniref:DUF3247 family protein n=1 Tax=Luteimonas endophytica TaxID=3042023 RepID=A0ABT6J4A8_9GAMM|nr:DUF3247 family protein [Luteimonas endophytica]MDH5821654.1 DUF3247 family protein [Luteimonas endophytica]